MPLARRTAPLALLAAAALALTACAPGAGGQGDPPAETVAGASAVPLEQIPEITSIWWQQSQATADFDYSAHTTDDADDLADLRDVLAQHGVTGEFRFDHTDCEGGLTTWVRYSTAGGDEVELTTNSCEGETPFEADLNDLVTDWRTR